VIDSFFLLFFLVVLGRLEASTAVLSLLQQLSGPR